MDPLLIVAVLAVVVAGLAVYAFRLSGQLRSAEARLAGADERVSQAELLRLQLNEVSRERDTAREEAATLRPLTERCARQEQDLVTLRAEKEALAAAKAAFERGEAERADAFAKQLAQIKELEAKLETKFGDLAGKALETAHDAFLKRAAERLTHEGQQNEAKLKALIAPVETTLKRYEEKLNEVEKERVDHYAGLREAVQTLHAGHTAVRDETAKLVNALRSSPKARGRWGEQSLKNVLEQAGLSSFADFATEVSVDTDEGRLRPDVIVRLPGGRKLIIDAKCSLNAFLDANDATEDSVRKAHLVAHKESIRTHAQQLGSKNYWAQFGDAADYVVMYIPGEHFLTAALEQDDALWEWAFERKVLLATPTNLVAIARTVASVWRQEKLAEQAAEIAALGKDLHSSIAVIGEHVKKLGRNLELATGAYNDFVGGFERNVMTKAKRFEALEVSGPKEIDALPVIESSPRPLTKLVPGPSEEAA